ASHVDIASGTPAHPLTPFLHRHEIHVLAVGVIVHGGQHGVHLDLPQRQHPSLHRQRPLGTPVVPGPAAHSSRPCSAMNILSTTSADWTAASGTTQLLRRKPDIVS